MNNMIPLDFPASSAINAPRDHSTFGLQAWILVTCRFLGITPTEFAKEASLAASTINRFLRESEGNLSARTIDALLATARRIEQTPSDWRRPAMQGAMFSVNVSVVGPAKAESFEDSERWKGEKYGVQVPLVYPYYRLPTAAFQITDKHAEPEFPPGTVLVSLTIGGQSEIQPKPGDHLLVFRGKTTEEKVLLELTVRRLTESPTGDLWLIPINPSCGIPEVRLGPKGTPLAPHFSREGNRVMGMVVSSIKPHADRGEQISSLQI